MVKVKKSKQYRIRLSEDDLKRWKDASKKEGCSLARFIRQAVESHLKGGDAE